MTTDGFSLAVFDTGLRQITRLKSFRKAGFDSADIDAAFEENRILDPAIQSLILTQNHCRFTPIPAALYDSSRERKLLACSTEVSDCEVTAADAIPGLGVYILYIDGLNPKPKGLPNCQNLHFSSAFLRFVTQEELTREEVDFFAHQYQNRLSVSIFRNENLLLANAYDTYTPADTLYYLLALFDHFSLSNKSQKLNISGDLSGDPALHQSLREYFGALSEIAGFQSRIYPEPSAELLGLIQTHQIILG